MRKILIIMGGFFPGKKFGGPPVSVDNFCSLMKDDECYIVTRDHDFFESKRFDSIQKGWNDRENCKVLYLSDSEYNKRTFAKVMNEIKPDILYLQGLFQPCVLPSLLLAKRYGISVLIAPRGELCKGAFRIKKWKNMRYVKFVKCCGLEKNIYWQSTSNEETDAIKRILKVDDNHIFQLDNIPSIPKKEFARRKKIAGQGRFVFLSRIHPKKNLLYAISLFKDIKGDVAFDIYGPIEDEEYWNLCLAEIKCLPANVKVMYQGLVDHNNVHDVFSQYDAFLFPTLSENYGHVIAESLAVGTPVIISNHTPWNDVCLYGAGYAISLDEKIKFISSIESIINMREDYTETSNSAKKCFAEKCRIDHIRSKYSDSFLQIELNKNG